MTIDQTIKRLTELDKRSGTERFSEENFKWSVAACTTWFISSSARVQRIGPPQFDRVMAAYHLQRVRFGQRKCA